MRVVVERVERVVVERDYALEDLDPTQRVFANRVIAWAREVVRVYKRVEAGERRLDVPRLRSWLGGSAGSRKSTTLISRSRRSTPRLSWSPAPVSRPSISGSVPRRRAAPMDALRTLARWMRSAAC